MTSNDAHGRGPCIAPRPMHKLTTNATNKNRFRGLFWKAARIGERLSPWVSIACIAMGLSILFS